jgi:hypothetical protein
MKRQVPKLPLKKQVFEPGAMLGEELGDALGVVDLFGA